MNTEMRMEMRVAIMKDVIAQLDAKKIKPALGTYMTAGDINGDTYEKNINQNTVDSFGVCAVCELGAVFMSTIRLFNKIDEPYWSLNYGKIEFALRKYFTVTEIRHLEAVFEFYESRLVHFPAYEKYRKAFRWKHDSEVIMRNICECVIEMNGEIDANEIMLRGIKVAKQIEASCPVV